MATWRWGIARVTRVGVGAAGMKIFWVASATLAVCMGQAGAVQAQTVPVGMDFDHALQQNAGLTGNDDDRTSRFGLVQSAIERCNQLV